jgi:hypothetical protein
LVIHAAHPHKVLAALKASPALILGAWAEEPVTPELAAAMLKAGCAWAPALQNLHAFLPLHELTPSLRGMSEPGWLQPQLLRSLNHWPGLLRYAKKIRRPAATRAAALANVLAMSLAGVPVVMGSMSGLPGLPHGATLRAEWARLAEAGLSPMQILRAASSSAASALGDAGLGSVKSGHEADLLILRGDPLEDPAALRQIASVLRGGRIWSADELARP